jgi:hypothetical protein
MKPPSWHNFGKDHASCTLSSGEHIDHRRAGEPQISSSHRYNFEHGVLEHRLFEKPHYRTCIGVDALPYAN